MVYIIYYYYCIINIIYYNIIILINYLFFIIILFYYNIILLLLLLLMLLFYYSSSCVLRLPGSTHDSAARNKKFCKAVGHKYPAHLALFTRANASIFVGLWPIALRLRV